MTSVLQMRTVPAGGICSLLKFIELLRCVIILGAGSIPGEIISEETGMVSHPYLQVSHLWIQMTVDQKYSRETNSRKFKKTKLEFCHMPVTIYIVLVTASTLEVI